MEIYCLKFHIFCQLSKNMIVLVLLNSIDIRKGKNDSILRNVSLLGWKTLQNLHINYIDNQLDATIAAY